MKIYKTAIENPSYFQVLCSQEKKKKKGMRSKFCFLV